MKTIIKNEIMLICLGWEDIERLKLGASVSERYDGEHKVHVHMFPQDLVRSHLPYDQNLDLSCDAEFKFCENNDLDVYISALDLKNSLIRAVFSVWSFQKKGFMFQHATVVMPDGSSTGYVPEEGLEKYFTRRAAA